MNVHLRIRHQPLCHQPLCHAGLFFWFVACLACCRAEAASPPITALCFLPDGTAIVSGSQKGIEVRSFPALRFQADLPTNLAHIHDLEFSADGSVLAAAGGTPGDAGEVEFFRWPDGGQPGRRRLHDDVVYDIACLGSTGTASDWVTASADHRIAISEAAGRSRRLAGHSRGVLALAVLPGFKQFVSAGSDHSLRVWQVADGQLQRTMNNHTAEVRCLAARPGERALPMIASASADRTVRLWQPTIGRMVRFVRLDREPLAIAWTPSGRYLAASCQDGSLTLIDADNVREVATVAAIDGWAYAVAVSPDGRWAAVAGSGGQLRKFRLDQRPFSLLDN